MFTVLDALPYAAVISMWTVSIARWKMALARDTRFAWTAMVSLAAAQLLQVEPGYRAFENATGVVGSAAVAKHALTLISAASVAVASTEALIPHDGPPPRLRRWMPWVGLTAALALSIAPWVIDTPRRLPPTLGGRAEYFDATWRSAVHWTVYLAYLGWALGIATRACWRFRTATDESASRKAFTWVGLGTAVSLAYTAEKAVVVVVWLCGGGSLTVVLVDQAAEAAICLVGLPLIALGCSYEALVVHVAEFRRQTQFRRALRAIKPFAEVVYKRFPYMRTAFSPRKPDERVVAAVAAIHEALRQLTSYYPVPEIDQLAHEERTARQAQWLLRALASFDLGRAPTLDVTAGPVDDTGHSLDSAWALAAVYTQAQVQAAAVGRSPNVFSTPIKDTYDAELQSAA
jgi:hypothetical protein